jgi:hypothetical protein
MAGKLCKHTPCWVRNEDGRQTVDSAHRTNAVTFRGKSKAETNMHSVVCRHLAVIGKEALCSKHTGLTMGRCCQAPGAHQEPPSTRDQRPPVAFNCGVRIDRIMQHCTTPQAKCTPPSSNVPPKHTWWVGVVNMKALHGKHGSPGEALVSPRCADIVLRTSCLWTARGAQTTAWSHNMAALT